MDAYGRPLNCHTESSGVDMPCRVVFREEWWRVAIVGFL